MALQCPSPSAAEISRGRPWTTAEFSRMWSPNLHHGPVGEMKLVVACWNKATDTIQISFLEGIENDGCISNSSLIRSEKSKTRSTFTGATWVKRKPLPISAVKKDKQENVGICGFKLRHSYHTQRHHYQPKHGPKDHNLILCHKVLDLHPFTKKKKKAQHNRVQFVIKWL